MIVLVLGASGMIGSTFFTTISGTPGWDVFGTVRDAEIKKLFPAELSGQLISGIDVLDQRSLENVFADVRPDVVINCAGLTKHLPGSDDDLVTTPINALFPHQLADLCASNDARLIHISTDCVFSGKKGGYVETDTPDASDIYGRSKHQGEVDYPHAITLRTSTIGSELETKHGLLEWFLAQKGECRGFTKAIFSGLPTVVLARIIRDIVIPRPEMSGLFHVAAVPISKYDLLKLIAQVYEKPIKIIPDDTLVIDRSLNADKFNLLTGYVAPKWPELIKEMHS